MFKRPILRQISKDLKAKKFSGATKVLIKLLKLSKLVPKDRLLISQQLQWVGEPEMALKILGKLVPANELSALNDESLLLQLRIAYMFNFLGAKKIGETTFFEIRNIFEANDSLSKETLGKFYAHFANFKFGNYYYKEALELYRKACENSQKDSERFIFAKLGQADCLSSLGNYTEALEVVDQLIEKASETELLFQGIFLQAKGEYLVKSNEYKQAHECFKQSYLKFGSDIKTKDFSYLLLWDGIRLLEDGEKAKAQTKFEDGLAISMRHQFQPALTRQFLLWLELSGKVLTLAQRVTSRLHPTFLPHRTLLKINVPDGEKEGHPLWLKHRAPESSGDCIYLHHEELEHCCYNQLISNIDIKKPLLDLNSGLVRTSTDKGIILLTEIEVKLIYALVAAGSLGINHYMLSDFVYRQSFQDMDDGTNRVRAKIPSLKKFIPIIKKKHYYYCDFSSLTSDIILPMNFSSMSTINYLKASKSEFSRVDVEHLYSLSKGKSLRLIESWIDDGIVVSTNTGKNITYKIN